MLYEVITKSVANLSLGQNRSAQILSVGSRAFLVGITDRSVNLIAELDDRELIDAMNLAADKTSSAGVITSYSIHYTKLYESRRERRAYPAYLQPEPRADRQHR